MSIDALRQSLPDFARDVRLNLGAVLSEEGSPGLAAGQIWGVALACAYATRSPAVVAAVADHAQDRLGAADREAVKAAATIMAMNNVYYRAMHLGGDGELAKLPAKLRMNVIGKPGVAKVDFELYCLAVSAINGCGSCIAAHIQELRKAGIGSEAVQSAVRIAAVVQATAQAVAIG